MVQVDLYLVQRCERHVELSALHEHLRQTETQLLIKSVLRPARQDAGARRDGLTRRGGHPHPLLVDVQMADSSAGPDLRPVRLRATRQRRIERRTIDDGGVDVATLDRRRVPGDGMETRRLGHGQDRARIQVQFVERIAPDNTGAMYRHPNLRMLLEHQRIVPLPSEGSAGHQPRRPRTDDDDVAHNHV